MRKISFLLLFLALITAGSAADGPAAPTGPVKEALDKMLQAYVDLKSGIITMNIQVVDPEYAGTQITELRLVRPKKLYWHGSFKPEKAGEPGFDVYVITDGKEITVYDTKTPKEYDQGKLPDPIRAIDLADYFNMGMGNMFLHAMTGEWQKVLGGRTVELTEPNVLRFVAEDSVDELTLDPATHLVVKVANYQGGKPMAQGTITYSRVGEELEDSQFGFTPPEGAVKMDIERER